MPTLPRNAPVLLSRSAVIALALVAAIATSTYAQPGDLTGFSFLRLESSARAAALAGSWISIGETDPAAMFYNPAQLNPEMHGMLSVSYLNHLSDINAGMVSYSREYRGIGTLAGGIRYLNWGDLEGADENGERTGSFGANDIALSVGAARSYDDQLRYGANVHFIYSNVSSYSASALAIDLGATYVAAGGRVHLATSINNLGVAVSSLGSTRDKLPLDLRLGISTRLEHLPLTLSLTAYNLHDIGDGLPGGSSTDNVLQHFAVGGEFAFTQAFSLRLGYNHRRHESLKLKSRLDFAGVGIGAGIKVRRIRFDYAYNSWSSVGGLNQLSVSARL